MPFAIQFNLPIAFLDIRFFGVTVLPSPPCSFVQEFGREDNQRISLDVAATTLGVERRRIYDIVNVLESVGIVSRQAKNCYAWRGFTQIHAKLGDLQRKASSDLYGGPDDFRMPIAHRKPSKKASSEPDSPSKDKAIASSVETDPDPDPDVSNSQSQSQTHSQTQSQSSTVIRSASRKEKSLGVLSQRFVQLFLLAGSSTVSLETAAVQLLGRTPSDVDPLSVSPAGGDASKLLKTKVRRLYDIANILTSLNLIEKVHTVYRKPAFKWLGPDASCAAIQSLRHDACKRTSPTLSFDERGRCSVKRRRVSTAKESGDGDMFDVASNGVGSDSRNECDIDAGLDGEIMRKIMAVLNTFPEDYASRWRSYVKSVNLMLIRGQVSKAKAYESVSSVVSQYKRIAPDEGEYCSPENETTDRGRSRQRALNVCDGSVNEVAGGIKNVVGGNVSGVDGRSNTANVVDRRIEGEWNGKESDFGCSDQCEKVDKGTYKECSEGHNNGMNMHNEGGDGNVGSSSEVKKEEVYESEDGLKSGAYMGEHKCVERCESNGMRNAVGGDSVSTSEERNEDEVVKDEESGRTRYSGGVWSAEYIEEYMANAKAAGPEYEMAAEAWLQQFRNWQKMWAGSINSWGTSMSRDGGNRNASDDFQCRDGGGDRFGGDRDRGFVGQDKYNGSQLGGTGQAVGKDLNREATATSEAVSSGLN